MKRKDCEDSNHADQRSGAPRPARAARLAVSIALVVGAPASQALAGSVRLWPSAVVLDETVHLADLCELAGFDASTERMLAGLTVTSALPAGGSRLIHMDMIRSVLAAGGANMATVTLSGATQCAVTRPSSAGPTSVGPTFQSVEGEGVKPVPHEVERTGTQSGSTRAVDPAAPASSPAATLRRAVIDHFNAELARYGGTAELVFDRTSQQVLDLSGPTYEFRVRRRNGSPLGLTPVEVDVLAEGRTVQTVPLVVQVSMLRRVVIARRSINQGAAIRAHDVELTPLSFRRLDKLGIDDAAHVVGQRAKRFIPAGSLIGPTMLESVPLVTRGQLVTLTSVAGGVRVVTTAKALRDGLLGETITVRAADNRRVEFDGVVVGPGTVQIGTLPATQPDIALARNSDS